MRSNLMLHAFAAMLLATVGTQAYPTGDPARDPQGRMHDPSPVARMLDRGLQNMNTDTERIDRAGDERRERDDLDPRNQAVDTPEVNRGVNNTVDGRPGP